MENRPTVRPGSGRLLTLADLTLEDVESVRLVLQGSSVIEWPHLHFRDHDEVYRFLRVNEFNRDSKHDLARLKILRREAVTYLRETLHFTIPQEIAEAVPTPDLFLIASRKGPHQPWACVVLKVMHIVHHLAGRELALRLPISDDQVFHAVELKVIEVVEELRAAGYPITEFAWSRKQRDSLITKLLAKRSTLAATIYDKLRFRLTVKDKTDLLPILAVLARQLVPFNYVVPEASINGLVSLKEDLKSTLFSTENLHSPEQVPSPNNAPLNEFSGPDYRIINFVADLPVRIDSIVPADQVPEKCGHVVFILTEFQLADKNTSVNNNIGESSHDAYKTRQREKVRQRLLSK